MSFLSMNFKSPLQLPSMETHMIKEGGSFRSFLLPAGKACVKLCLPGHSLEKHPAFLLIKSIMGGRGSLSGSGRAGASSCPSSPGTHTPAFLADGFWRGWGHRRPRGTRRPVSASCERVEDPELGGESKPSGKPFRVGCMSTGSYGQCHSSFLEKRRNRIIFIPFLIVSINFSGKIHPKAVSFWNLRLLWELKLVGHPKPVTGDTTLLYSKPGGLATSPLTQVPPCCNTSVEDTSWSGSGRLGEVQEYFRGTCRPAEDSRPPSPQPTTVTEHYQPLFLESSYY